jgi:hypothetical protein
MFLLNFSLLHDLLCQIVEVDSSDAKHHAVVIALALAVTFVGTLLCEVLTAAFGSEQVCVD